LDELSISCTPTSTPTSTAGVQWVIEYETAGNFYMMPAREDGVNQNAAGFANPSGVTPAWTNVATDFEALVPTDLTVTKVALSLAGGTGGAGIGYTMFVRKNNTTDSSFSAAVLNNTPIKAVSSTGSLAFTAGDTMVMKYTTTGNPSWLTMQYCITIVPTNPGEVVQLYGNNAAPSTTAVGYESPQGAGVYTTNWTATELLASLRFPACTMRKFYVKLTTATGASKTRAFTIRKNTVSTSLVATLTNTATGNDTTHTATFADGDSATIMHVPTSTPAATTGVKMGFVMDIPQPQPFFTFFS
jgi:hypothetical protein